MNTLCLQKIDKEWWSYYLNEHPMSAKDWQGVMKLLPKMNTLCLQKIDKEW